MAKENRLWGAPRIHGELLKRGIAVSERTVSRYLPDRRTAPSQIDRQKGLHATTLGGGGADVLVGRVVLEGLSLIHI